MAEHKVCYGECDRCVWQNNGGCSEWNGYMRGTEDERQST